MVMFLLLLPLSLSLSLCPDEDAHMNMRHGPRVFLSFFPPFNALLSEEACCVFRAFSFLPTSLARLFSCSLFALALPFTACQ